MCDPGLWNFSRPVFCDHSCGHDGGHMSEVTLPVSSTAHYRPETRLVHSGTLRSQFGETSEALFLTQGFVYDSAEQCEARFVGKEPGYLYSRFSNPTVNMFETRTNPTLEVLDIAAIAAIAHDAGARLVVDNVFATPIFQSPFALGADCVVYSATKHIDGQGRCLGGIILGSQKFIMDKIHVLIRQTGPSMSPFNAWVLLKGLETLAVRVRRQTDSAATLAVALAEHPKIARLMYPGRPDHPQAEIAHRQMRGGSTLVAFEIEGGKAAAFRFQDALKLVLISNNLGDAKSLITHPATTTHQRLTPAARAALGISEGLVRLSCGLEHPDDLLEDLLTALKAA